MDDVLLKTQKSSLGALPNVTRTANNRPHSLSYLRDPLFFAPCKTLAGNREPTTSFFAETGVWLAFIGLFLVPLIAIALY